MCATRTILVKGSPQQQVPVQWKDVPMEEASWEPFDAVRVAYPGLHLEDKVVFEGSVNDTILPRESPCHTN